MKLICVLPTLIIIVERHAFLSLFCGSFQPTFTDDWKLNRCCCCYTISCYYLLLLLVTIITCTSCINSLNKSCYNYYMMYFINQVVDQLIITSSYWQNIHKSYDIRLNIWGSVFGILSVAKPTYGKIEFRNLIVDLFLQLYDLWTCRLVWY